MKMMTKWILIIWILSVGAIAASAQTADCAKVQPGDGFLRIAQRCNVKSDDLIAANKNAAWFKNDNFVPRNVTLTLPSQSAVVTQTQVAQGDAQKDAQITQLQNEVNSLKQQIAQLTKTKGSGDLTKQVADLTKQLEAAKKVTATGSPVVAADLEKELVRTKAELQGFKDNADLMFLMNPFFWIAGAVIALFVALGMWLWMRSVYGLKEAKHYKVKKPQVEIAPHEVIEEIDLKGDYPLPVTREEIRSQVNQYKVSQYGDERILDLYRVLMSRNTELLNDKAANEQSWNFAMRASRRKDFLKTEQVFKDSIYWLKKEIAKRQLKTGVLSREIIPMEGTLKTFESATVN